MLGVSESTVRRWCDRDLLRASRTSGKHRRIERAALLEFARREGIAVASMATSAGRGGRVASPDELGERLFQALVEADERRARGLVVDLATGAMDPAALCDLVIAPAMHRIGEAWARGHLDIHQEHVATEILHGAISAARSYILVPDDTAPRAVCASLSGDPYALGPAMSALVLQFEEFRPWLVGVDTPATELMLAARATAASIITVSVGVIPEPARFIEDFHALAELAERESILIAVGGQGLERRLRSQISADFFGDTMSHLAGFARRHRRAIE